MTTVTLPDGRTVDFVVRREVGSINRFLYSFAMLAPAGESSAQPDLSLWNRKLLYWFQGGVAIGHTQGTVHSGSLNPDILRLGWAIVHSSGNNTGTHYNLNLAGETAMMTKERFIERYGAPLYTVGLGGSGGAIQQYVIAQNHPGVLDGLLPVQSYPDMVTQTIHVGDCELLEHYMDATDRTNAKWRTTKNRSWLVGFNAEEDVPGGMNPRVNDPFAPLKQALGYSTALGSTECVPGWRGLTPLAMNPLFGQVPNAQFYEPLADILVDPLDALRRPAQRVWRRRHRRRARHLGQRGRAVRPAFAARRARSRPPSSCTSTGTSAAGSTRATWCRRRSPSWAPARAEIQKALTIPGYFDPWSSKNMLTSASADQPAPRSKGDPIAMRAAYTSGHVFSGKLKVPAIDHRQYMERELDMHNSHQSFAARQRVLRKMGHSDNMVIWFTDTTPGVPKASQSLEALAVMDRWLNNIRLNPRKSIERNKPAEAADACYDLQGRLMYRGDDAWNGILDHKAAGRVHAGVSALRHLAHRRRRAASKAASTTARASRCTRRWPMARMRRGRRTRARSRSSSRSFLRACATTAGRIRRGLEPGHSPVPAQRDNALTMLHRRQPPETTPRCTSPSSRSRASTNSTR